MSNYSDSRFVEDDNTPWFKVFSMITNGSTVLDVGCSSGTFGEILNAKKNCTVDGVEIDESDRQIAAQKLRKVFNFNIENGVPDELKKEYDYVYFGDVIEHLFYPVRALKNTKDLLREKGKVLFSIPNMEHMSVRLDVMEGKFGYGKTGLLDATHLHYYTKKEISRVFAEAGYEIKHLEWVHRDIPSPILSKRLQAMGLGITKKFIDKSKKVEAAAYQYIGIAVPTPKELRKVQIPKVSPATDDMEKYIKSIQEEYNNSVVRIRAHYENDIAQKVRSYNDLEASSIRVAPGLKKIAKTILGKRRNRA